MRANNMMTAISRLFGQDPQGKSRAMKTKPANDNAGLQPGGVGKTNNTLRCKGYAMHQESARICRKSRLLQLLLNKGPVSRHDLDELLGAENTPDLVMRLRRNNGFELPCERRPMIDGDGLRALLVRTSCLMPISPWRGPLSISASTVGSLLRPRDRLSRFGGRNNGY